MKWISSAEISVTLPEMGGDAGPGMEIKKKIPETVPETHMFAPETDGWNLEYYFFFQDGNFSGFMLNFGGVWQLMGGVQ